MMEIWKDIKDYPNYMVSNLGRVKNLNYNKTGREQLMTPQESAFGYMRIKLCKNGKIKTIGIHRLVSEAFIPNPNNYPQVNHKNEDKTNNCVWNLEWCDANYNDNYGTRNKRSAEARTNGKCSKPVLQIDKDTLEVIKEWPSAHEVERQLGYSNASISQCCNGKRNTASGYKWKYKEVS